MKNLLLPPLIPLLISLSLASPPFVGPVVAYEDWETKPTLTIEIIREDPAFDDKPRIYLNYNPFGWWGVVMTSRDLQSWVPFYIATDDLSSVTIVYPPAPEERRRFWRVVAFHNQGDREAWLDSNYPPPTSP